MLEDVGGTKNIRLQSFNRKCTDGVLKMLSSRLELVVLVMTRVVRQAVLNLQDHRGYNTR